MAIAMGARTDAAKAWEPLLRTPEPRDHLIQLYTDEAFLTRAVTQFLGAGLAHDEGALVIAIPEHIEVFTAQLGSSFDVDGARARGQLVTLDAASTLARFMVEGSPDRSAFFGLMNDVLGRMRSDGYGNIRAFGEMVDLLWAKNLAATIQLEELWNEALGDGRVCLLCAYRIDNFDRDVHRGILHRISSSHSHFIPVDDYDRLDQAVERAYRDVFGSIGDPRGLREMLVSRYASPTAMPPAQAALHAVRELKDSIADDVLERARRYYDGGTRPSARRS